MEKTRRVRQRPEPNRAKAVEVEEKDLIGYVRSALRKVKEENILTIVVGVLLLATTAYLVLALLSYLIYGRADQSVILQHIGEPLSQYRSELQGFAGAGGSKLMHRLVNEWIGLAIVFPLYMLLGISFGLLGQAPVRYLRLILFSLVTTFWSSLALTLCCKPFEDRLFFYAGGTLGRYMYQSLDVVLGLPGIIIITIGGLLLLVFLFSRTSRKRYNRWSKKRLERMEVAYTPAEVGTELARGSVPVVSEEMPVGEKAERTDVIAFAQDPEVEESVEGEVSMDRATPKRSWKERLLGKKKAQLQPSGDAVRRGEEVVDEPSLADSDTETSSNNSQEETNASLDTVEVDEPESSLAAHLGRGTSEGSVVPSATERGRLPHEASADVPMQVIDHRHQDDEEGDDESLEASKGRGARVVASQRKADRAVVRAAELVDEQGLYDPHRELPHYQMPSVELLKQYDQEKEEIDYEEIEENKRMIISTLNSFKIEVTSITATVGPAITLYEVVPAAGIHISRIRNLEDNISMSLSAMGIRIIAPIPGKGTIGLEVPNKKPKIVSMRSALASKAFREAKGELPIAFGRTITNELFVFDLAKTPHLLVAGATGQGKSVGLNAIIASLLYKRHPSELKFVMVDPKMVEFSMYAKIEKHYMAKLADEEQVIITDPSRVAPTLNSLCEEMEERYTLLAKASMRNIKEYNEKFKNRLLNPHEGHRFLPYIVLIIDEYGDHMLTGGKEIETPITRLAQKARAVGIHAIIATQRPMATIITGAIKANFPGRIAFKVMSSTDSRIILDAAGANRLIGRGDSLYSQGNDLTRVQCAFIDTPEVNSLVDFISQQRGYPEAYELPEVKPEATGAGDSMMPDGLKDPSQRDEYFYSAAEMIVIEQRASVSFIQQKFAIGYNRSSRLMSQLEYAGIVGPADGQKPREILVSSVQQLQQLLSSEED